MDLLFESICLMGCLRSGVDIDLGVKMVEAIYSRRCLCLGEITVLCAEPVFNMGVAVSAGAGAAIDGTIMDFTFQVGPGVIQS